MSCNHSYRWIWAVLFVTVVPIVAVHISCVAILGPGSWGSGVEEKIPAIQSIYEKPDLSTYPKEWKTVANTTEEIPTDIAPWAIEKLGDLKEELVSADRIKATGRTVILTTSSDARQKLYFPEAAGKPMNQISIPPGKSFLNLTLLKKDLETLVTLVCWNPWSISPLEKLTRYFRSWQQPTLRPEYYIYAYHLKTKTLEPISPGYNVKASPDRSMAVFTRSGSIGTTLVSLHIWTPTSGEIQTVASLSETNPGSGHSFHYKWSSDSKALFLWGVAGGFQPRTHNALEFRWAYFPTQKRIFSIH